MKKLQVLEPMHGGHHTNYLLAMLPSIQKLLTVGALEQAVVSVTPLHMKLMLQETAEQIAQAPTIEWDVTLPATAPGPSHRDRKRLHHAILDSVDRHRSNGLICTSADYDIVQNAMTNILQSKTFFWPRYSVGILHYGYPKNGSNAKETLKRLVYEAAWKGSRWHKLLMVNPLIYEDQLARGKAHPNRYDFLPDPVPAINEMTKAEARRTLGLPVEGKYIGSIGMMDRRKAIPELLAAFVNAGLALDVRLLLAGRLDSIYAQLLDDKYSAYVAQGRIVILNRDLTEIELRCGYAALDLHAVLQYRRFNLSANALKCVAFNRPFICDDVGFAAMIAKRFSAGIVCTLDDTSSVQAALRKGLARDSLELQTKSSRSLIDYHTNDNFARVALNNVMGNSAANVLGHTYRWTSAYSPAADLQAA